MKTFTQLLHFLTLKDRRKAFYLLIMTLIMAMLDMLGVFSILPFMTVLTNPSIVESNVILKKIFIFAGKFGVETNRDFLFFLGIAVLIMLVFSLIFKALTMYSQARFAAICQHGISRRFVEGFLHQPYSWILNQHSADLGKIVLSEVGVIISKGLKPVMAIITQIIISVSIISMLVIINPKIALIIGATISMAYLVIYSFARGLLTRIGRERLMANEFRFTTVIEAFGAFKEVKIARLEKVFLKKFSKYSKIFANHEASAQIISVLPRFFLEAISFGGMLLMVLYLMKQNDNFTEIVPLISLYAFAGYRLMPTFQLIYSNTTNLRTVTPSLESLYKNLIGLKSLDLNHTQEKSFLLKKSITLNHISYQYPNSSKKNLKDICLNIPAFSTVGFVGITGSGKTTIVDIILGLLEAQQGTLEVDSKVINNKNVRAWQNSLGYVPQQIFLMDHTVSANIAFGIDPKEIDQKRVEHVAKIASLHDFVINDLALKYQTTLGERGIRLSGGQRQRIGIARALYHNPKVLILDEATSALDNLTEKIIMEAIHDLNDDMTIIIIAHRLSTVKKCDNIYLFESGKLKDQGTYESLIKNNELFFEKTD